MIENLFPAIVVMVCAFLLIRLALGPRRHGAPDGPRRIARRLAQATRRRRARAGLQWRRWRAWWLGRLAARRARRIASEVIARARRRAAEDADSGFGRTTPLRDLDRDKLH